MGDKWLISRTSFSSTETQMKLDKIDMDIKKKRAQRLHVVLRSGTT